MNRLKSTGVFFTSPPPAEGLPAAAGQDGGRQSNRRLRPKGFSRRQAARSWSASSRDERRLRDAGQLDLKKSANITLHTVKPYTTKQVISAVDGGLTPIDEENGQWLVPGAGC